MSNSFVKGAIIITIATILSKIIGSVYRIPLQNIAGDEVLGIFTLVYPVYMSVLIVTVAGIPLAISKLIAEANVEGRRQDVHAIFVTASVLAVCFGLVSFSFMFVFADAIAYLLGGSYAVYSIIVVSVTLLIAPYMAVYRGFFQGFNNMKPTAVSQVLEQFVRVLLILVAAYVLTQRSLSSEAVAGGVMIGSVVGVLVSLFYLRSIYLASGLKQYGRERLSFSGLKSWARKILIISIPICIGALTMALLNMVDSVTVPMMLRVLGYEAAEITHWYGIYGRGLALVQIAVVFASALVLPLVPKITAERAKGNASGVREIMNKAYRFTHFTSWPIVIGLVVLTLPVNLALFTNLQGNAVVAILSLSAFFTAFSVLTTGMLQGMDKSKQAAVIVLFCTVLKVGLNLLLVASYGLVGAAVATCLTYVVLASLNMLVIYKEVPFHLLQRECGVFAFSGTVMGAVVGAPLLFSQVGSWTRGEAFLYLVGMVLLGALVYGVLTFLLKGIKKEELRSFRALGKDK